MAADDLVGHGSDRKRDHRQWDGPPGVDATRARPGAASTVTSAPAIDAGAH